MLKHRDWVGEATVLFAIERPQHFTNFNHCDECAEHDQTLLAHTPQSISLAEVGSPAWDPITFCSVEGKIYFLPGLIRLCLESIEDEFYFSQLLFHLEYDGHNNTLVQSLTSEQRQFVADFIAMMIECYPAGLEEYMCADEAFRALDIWSTQ